MKSGSQDYSRRRLAGPAVALLASLIFAGFALSQEVKTKGSQETLPKSVAPQPVAFSHRIHAGKLTLSCQECHSGAATGDEAKLPPLDLCLRCHRTIKADSPEVAKLRAAQEEGKRIAWVPVYRVPDFVFFSHATHIHAGLPCAQCHGAVETHDVLQKEISTSMNACLDCHRKRKAPVGCSTCHQLGY